MAKPDRTKQLRLDNATVWDDAPGIPDWAYAFHDYVLMAIDVEPLAEMYEEGGRKPIDPRLLAGITILQAMEGVGDRRAVQMTLVRRDWRVALGLDSSYRGFCPTVLVRFRQRLMAAGLDQELFRQGVAAAKKHGMLGGRRRLRVDSTKLVADVSMLSRGDAIRETMRVVLAELEDAAPELGEDPEFVRLMEEHGEECWLGRKCSLETLVRLGRDGYALLALCEGRGVGRASVLRRVLSENFVEVEGEFRAREQEELDSGRVQTPHEPDALQGKRDGDRWVGDQVHIVETADAGLNVVVGVVVTDPRREDSTVLSEALDVGLAAVPETEQLFADKGYASVKNTLESEAAGVDLVCPARRGRRGKWYGPSDFEIDLECRRARCPAGEWNATWREYGSGTQVVAWSDEVCAGCARRGECTKSRKGRHVELSPQYARLSAERGRMKTPEFWEEYRHRAGIETTISELVRRHGLRRSRYRGAAGRRLHAFLSVTALNGKRLIRFMLEGGGAPGAGTSVPGLAASG